MKVCPYCAEEIQDAAIVCKHCGRDLAPGATPTAPAPSPQPPAPGPAASPTQAAVAKGSGCGTTIVTLLGIVAALMVVGFLSQGTPTPAGPDRVGAFLACKQFVTKRLKSPSTAEFPNSSGAVVNLLSGDEWVVESHVDSQNGFGAMIRSTFTCTVKPEGDSWRLINIKIGER